MIEVAQVLTKNEYPLITIFGQTGSVEFPTEYIWEVHRRHPGLIRHLVHSHPEGMTDMSEEDRTTLKAWTVALAPHLITLDVVTKIETGKISHKRYYYIFEPLGSWLARDKETPRIFQLVETSIDYVWSDNDLLKLSNL